MTGDILAVLLSWAGVLSGYTPPAHLPEIVMVPSRALQEWACAGAPCQVLGWHPPGNVIYLDDRLDPESDTIAASILVHELTHWLQQQPGRYTDGYTCEQAIAMEREAYGVQQQFLTAYGVYRPVGGALHRMVCLQ